MAVASLIIKAIDQATSVFKGIQSTGLNLVMSLENGLKSIGNLGQQFTTMGGLGVAAFTLVAKSAGEAEKALKTTMTMTGLNGKEYDAMFQKLSGYSKELSNEYGISGKIINEAFYQVLSSGNEAGTKGFKELTNAAILLNKLTGLDLAKGVEQLSDTINIFGDTAENSAKFVNVFFKASRLGATTVPQLMDAMTQAAPAARALGISMEETTSILTAFASKGIKGANAGYVLRRILNRLVSPTKKARDAMEELGLKVFDSTGKMRPIVDVFKDMQSKLKGLTQEQQANILKAIAGEHSYSSLAAVMQSNLDIIPKWTQALKDSAGEASNAWAELKKGFTETMNRIGISVTQTFNSIGGVVIKVLQPIIPQVENIISSIQKWISENPKLVETLVKIGLAGSVFLVIAGAILSAVAAVGLFVVGFVEALPALAGFSAALAVLSPLLIAFGKYVVDNIGKLPAIIEEIAPKLQTFVGNIASFILYVSEQIPLVITMIQTEFSKLGELFSAVWDLVKGIMEPFIQWIQEIWKAAVDYILQIWNEFWPELKPVLDDLFVQITKIFNDIKERFLPVWNAFLTIAKPILIKFMGFMKDQFLNFLYTELEKLKKLIEIIGAAWNVFIYVWDNYLSPFMANFGKFITFIVGKLKEFYDENKKYIDLVQTAWKVFSAVMESVGKGIINNLWAGMKSAFAGFSKWYDDNVADKLNALKVVAAAAGINIPGINSGSLGSAISKSSGSILSDSLSSKSSGGNVTLQVGTLIADDNGLRELQKKLNVIQLGTDRRLIS